MSLRLLAGFQKKTLWRAAWRCGFDGKRPSAWQGIRHKLTIDGGLVCLPSHQATAHSVGLRWWLERFRKWPGHSRRLTRMYK